MSLESLQFDNRLTEQLPADKIDENYCRSVEHAAFSYVDPTPTQSPVMIAYSTEVAALLDLEETDFNSSLFTDMITGNQILSQMTTYSLCYGGHQFGQWASQLGDGRAINLGEISTHHHGRQTLQLKGAGKTPYSRHADGLAVLRSSVREFLCSESMFHLGIPTTRALSLCLTGETVLRDKMYDGNAKHELGAITCRVSPSFLRFGSFQLPASRNDDILLKQLIEFSINNDFEHLKPQNGVFTESTYLAWFEEISERTCDLIVHWMRVGFVHGVINTDNMSIIGETIDYGPYGWIDDFDLDWTPNTSDRDEGRYAFGRQAHISQWNIMQLANAIYPIIKQAAPLQTIINDYLINYQQKWGEMMAQKLGLIKFQGNTDLSLFQSLESLLSDVETDMTLFYRALANVSNTLNLDTHSEWLVIFTDCYYEIESLSVEYKEKFRQWLTLYIDRINKEGLTHQQRAESMNQVNPKYVLRNYIAVQAIEAAEQGDYSEIIKLQNILKSPYQEQPEYEAYAKKRPDWARHKFGCSMLSCSS